MFRRSSPATGPRSALVPAAIALALAAAACADSGTGPGSGPQPPVEGVGSLGLMEITITGVSTGADMAATARSISPSSIISTADEWAALGSLEVVEDVDDTGIQLTPITVSSFAYGERGSGGQRYLSATFRVRNASADGVAYPTPLDNATLVAVSTNSTIGETPVSRLQRFDGAPASTALATGLRPTGAAAIDGEGKLTVQSPDVLQAFTEAEAADLAAVAGLDNVFPYGFVVRNPSHRLDRRLPANPAVDQFDGVVTFAFRVPLADDPADDPFSISVMMLAVSDTETRITQSFEGQMVCTDQFEERAAALRATTITLFDGGTYWGSLPIRSMPTLRTAGTAASPTATLPDAVTASYPPPPETIDLSDSTGVIGIIWDIIPVVNDPTSLRVRYGYYNASSDTINIPMGIDNFFVPGAAYRGQPTEFLPGLHTPPNGGFSVVLSTKSSPEYVWSLNGVAYRANLRNPEQTAPPTCGFRM